MCCVENKVSTAGIQQGLSVYLIPVRTGLTGKRQQTELLPIHTLQELHWLLQALSSQPEWEQAI